MKRITSIIVSVMILCGILYIPLTACAAKLSTGTKPTFDPNYTAVFNDFEDTSLVGFESNLTKDGVTAFTVVDTDDENYNHSFKIAAVTWAAIDDGNATKKDGTRATYKGVKGQTVNLFDEPLTVGNNYIMSYDYKNIAETFSGDQTVSFAPKHENFKVGTDYRDHIVYNDNQNWYKYSVGFTADVNSLKLKINTCGGAGAYIDNLLVVEAAEFKDLTDNSATIEVTEGEIVTNNKNGIANMVAKGNKLSFKVSVADSFYKAVVTHGGTAVTPVNGVYTIDKVTADIEVKTEIDKDVLDGVVKAEFPVDASNNITFSAGDTLARFMDETKILESLISLKNGSATVRRDEGLRDGYVLNIVNDSGEPVVSYTVKIDGTVTDYNPNSDKISVIDTYVSDTIAKSGTGITADNLEKSILNDGNRSAVANVIKKAMDGENVTIVTFGGSITQGAASTAQPSSITHTFTDTRNYSQLMGDWFKSVFGNNVTVKNAGIGATDTPYAIHRMNMDVMAFNPDMVIVEWDKNDVNGDTYKQATYENMLRKFIDKGVAVVMLGLCGKNTGGDDSSIKMHVPLAEKYDLPYISYRDAFGDKTNSYKSDLLLRLSEDGVHPNIVGHHLVALLLNNYFGNVYKDIASIGSYEPVMPTEPYNAEATVFGEGRVVDLDDAVDGKVQGVRVTSLGSFVKDTALSRPGDYDICENHARYAYKAAYSTSYEPMVIEIDNCYSLHLLLLRVNRTDGKFKVFIDNNEVTDTKGSFTSGTASDNTQIESTYAWASSRVCLNSNPANITLKILPINQNASGYVGLYGLLLADAPVVACTHEHTTNHDAVPSTCQTQGNNAYVTCDDCGEIISGSDAKLPLAGHAYTVKVDAEYLKSVANCGNRAVYYKSCSVCGLKSDETFETGNVDHDNHVGGTYKKNEKPATCREPGYTGDIYCRTCDALKSSGTQIPVTDHNPADAWSSDDTNHWHVCQTEGCSHKSDEAPHNGGEATCTKKAVCSVCGAEYGSLDASNHKHTEVRDDKKPTEQEKGYTGDTWCTDCNTKIADGKEIDKLEHKPALVKAVAATAAKEGNIEYYYCENCGKYYSDEEGTKEIKKEDTVIAKLAPSVIEGNNAKIDKSSKDPVSFRSDASFADFVRVELDGKELVKDKDYTIKEGSIIVTLTPEFLATLPAGDHTLSIVSVSGTANADFSITAEKAIDTSSDKGSSETSPQTRRDINAILWSLAGIISLTLLSVLGIFKKRLCKSR